MMYSTDDSTLLSINDAIIDCLLKDNQMYLKIVSGKAMAPKAFHYKYIHYIAIMSINKQYISVFRKF